MQIVILAAGESSRFEPFRHSYQHKSLIKILGKTIIEHTLDSIKRAGIKDIIIVVNKKEAFEKILGNGNTLGLTIKYVTLPEAKGMGAALLQAREYLEESFFLTNTNHIEIDSFVNSMQSRKKKPEEIVLLGKKDTGFNSFGFMKIQGENVIDVIEKPNIEISDALRVIGIYLLNKSFIDHLSKIPMEHYNFEKALGEFAKKGDVRFVQTDAKTFSLKYVWDLFAIKDYLLANIKEHISASSEISKSAHITGRVYIEEGVKIMDNAVVKGPVYIGKNAYIGTNAIIRNNSVVEENVVVGAFLELKNSILMAGSTTHTGVLEDSIVGKDCKIAAGIVTANVRLDRKNISTLVKGEKVDTGLNFFGVIVGDNVQFGIRVSTMPGTIIGGNSIIGPSTTVMKNLPQNTKYYTRFDEVVEESAAT